MEVIIGMLLKLLVKLLTMAPRAIWRALRRRWVLWFCRRRIRDEAGRLFSALQTWIKGRRWQTTDSAGSEIRASVTTLHELARLLALNRALPWRRYRVFGAADALRREIADDRQAAARFGLLDVEPGALGWRVHYAFFLEDYRRAYGQPADETFWCLPTKDEEPKDENLPAVSD